MIRWEADGYEVAFTTRVGGVSEGPYASLNLGRKSGDVPERADENRRIACEAIGADLEKLSLNYQVHSSRVLRAAPAMRGEHADLLGKRGSDGEPPPVEEIERLAAFREVVEQELASPHRLRDLAVDGNDLIELGFRPGPQLGHILHDLLDAVVDEPSLNTRDQLLAQAKERL